jgi:cytochrome c oxidase cbb3-type subunit 3/ubiquinol-cytochrome c reductase cytochrome c subunit
LSLCLVGCDLPGKPKEADRPVPADQVKNFDVLYSTHCAGCHGADGKLGPAPPLNDPLFLAIVPDAELLRVITEGRAVTSVQKSLMPAFARYRGGPLTDSQINVLAEGIKRRWGGEPPTGEPPPYLPPRGPGDKERGARLFDLACAACHGDEGKGAEQAGAINEPSFLALISDQALRRIVITGRGDLGMPDYSDSDWRSSKFKPLTSAEINDLVALLGYWRQGASSYSK